MLGPIAATGGNNLGEPRLISFNDAVIPGNQYFTVSVGPAVCRADTNCDGVVSFADINPFVQALGNLAGWQAAHPTCPSRCGTSRTDTTTCSR